MIERGDDGWDNKRKEKKNRKTKNDGNVHFLEELMTGCLKFENFELLAARLDCQNNVTKEEISNKLKEYEKLNKIVDKLHKYCANKQILIEITEIVVEMIKNKEIVKDT